MPIEAARKIEAVTGCDAQSLIKGDSRPVFLDGSSFTIAAWRKWNEHAPDAETVEATIDDLTFRLQTVLRAGGHGLFALAHAIGRAIDEATVNAGVAPSDIEAECRKSANVKAMEMTVAELKKSEVANCTGFSAAVAGFKSAQRCGVVIETYRVPPEDNIMPREKTISGAVGMVTSRRQVANLWRVTLPDGKKCQWRFTAFSVKVTAPKNGKPPALGVMP